MVGSGQCGHDFDKGFNVPQAGNEQVQILDTLKLH